MNDFEKSQLVDIIKWSGGGEVITKENSPEIRLKYIFNLSTGLFVKKKTEVIRASRCPNPKCIGSTWEKNTMFPHPKDGRSVCGWCKYGV